MKFKSYIKYPQWNTNQDAGFTLIELLVAAVIMSIVMTLAGSAFVAILEQNRKAESEIQTRQNLNRALDYIANDIRQASKIEAGSATGEVFKLTVPTISILNVDPAPDADPPTFGTSDPSDPNTPQNYNYGSTSTPTYSVATSSGVWQDPNNPTSSVMRDGSFLVNNIIAPVPREITTITNNCPNTTGTFMGNNGFYACIYTGGRKADLYLYGRLSPNGTILVQSTVYTRANGFNF
ncbi:MAG: type II secretion system protein [Nostocales cyanobacterium]|nr:MAG: type II secretion system protein [Nostocales cyanobacterium]TAF18318.1 MAG: type II secretion system protein [Nostocales cyanobacterium]